MESLLLPNECDGCCLSPCYLTEDYCELSSISSEVNPLDFDYLINVSDSTEGKTPIESSK